MGELGVLGDLAQRRLRVAQLPERGQRRLRQLGAALFDALLPAGLPTALGPHGGAGHVSRVRVVHATPLSSFWPFLLVRRITGPASPTVPVVPRLVRLLRCGHDDHRPVPARRQGRGGDRRVQRARRRLRPGAGRGRRRRGPGRQAHRDARADRRAGAGHGTPRADRDDRRQRPRVLHALVEAAMAELGRVDVLVNNAGIGTAVPATRETPEQFRQVIDVNLNGSYWMAQACGRVMEPGSSIVNISSVLGLTTGGLPQAAYSASKAGIIGLTRDLAQQWTGRKGIRVNALAPGFFASEMTDHYPDGYLDLAMMRVPVGRTGRPHGAGGHAGLAGLPRRRLRHRPDHRGRRRHHDQLTHVGRGRPKACPPRPVTVDVPLTGPRDGGCSNSLDHELGSAAAQPPGRTSNGAPSSLPTWLNRWTYRPELDGLRSVAVYLVVLFHCGVGPFDGGFVGVDLFFVLSGFLVSHVIWAEVDKHGSFRLGWFYARRVRRLLPGRGPGHRGDSGAAAARGERPAARGDAPRRPGGAGLPVQLAVHRRLPRLLRGRRGEREPVPALLVALDRGAVLRRAATRPAPAPAAAAPARRGRAAPAHRRRRRLGGPPGVARGERPDLRLLRDRDAGLPAGGRGAAGLGHAAGDGPRRPRPGRSPCWAWSAWWSSARRWSTSRPRRAVCWRRSPRWR